jgi:hypothetical protein
LLARVPGVAESLIRMRVITTLAVAFGISTWGAPAADAAPLFDKSMSPPAILEGIRVGMARADLAKAMSVFVHDDQYRDVAKRERYVTDADGAKVYVLFSHDVVARIGIEAPAAGLVDKLTRLWGKPIPRTNLANEGLVSWRAGGTRVDVACRESLCRLAYHRELGAAFFGTSVGAPGSLASIAIGTPRANVPAPYASGDEVPAGVEDVRVVVDLDERVKGFRIVGLPSTAGDALAAAWGAPIVIDSVPTWFAPKRGMRARYDAKLGVVQIAEYMPIAALLGPGDQIALPILGLTEKQLAAAYPKFRAQQGGGTIALPPTELASAPTMIGVALDPRSGEVARAMFAVPFVTAANKAAVVAVLEAKWGKAQLVDRGGAKRLTFPSSKARVEVSVDDAAAVLVIELSRA